MSNYGTIESTSNIGRYSSSDITPTAIGSQATSATITNGAAGSRAALISGYRYGLDLGGGGNAVSNFGTIQATGYGPAGIAVVINGYGTVVNNGTIRAATGSAIVLGGSGGITNNSGALIQGSTAIVLQGAGSTIDNFGTIIGTGGTAISLLNTDETLRIEAGSTIVGAVTGLQGSDTIDLVDAQVTSIVASNDTVTFLDNTSTIASLDLGVNERAGEITTTSDGQGGTKVVIVVQLDPGPTAGNGTTILGHNETVNLTNLISGLVTPGVPGDTETITAVSATRGSANVLNGVVSYTAPSIGPDALTYTVADEFGDTATGSVNITVDTGPIAANGATTLGHNKTANLTSLVDNLVSPGLTGDTETLTSVSALHGTATLSNGVVTYTTPATGPDSLTYTVADEYGDTATGSVIVTVDPGATAATGTNTLGHGKTTSLTSAITALVTPGITGDTETITAVTAAHGSTTVINGTVSYTAPTNGPDILTYTVTDEFGDTANGTLNVAVDSGPTAGAAAITLVAGQTTDLTSYLLGLDIPGIAGDTLTLTGDNTTGTHGMVTLANGDLTYSAPSTSGTDSFGYTVSDQYGDTAAATVTVTVASNSNIGNGSGTVVLGSNSGPTSFGGGNVTVIGGNGNDQISGGNGTDSVTLGNGSDTVQLGNGSGTVTLGNGNDSVTLGDGSNTVTVGNGNDTLKLGDGANTITLGTGSDTVTVGNQNNSITATGSATSTDTIAVGDGGNILNLGAGTYNVTEGNGADTIILGNGQYNVTAGNGVPDLFIYTVPSGELTMSFKNNDELVFRNSGFNLGVDNGHGTASLQAIAASLLSTNTDGSFATTANRFAYSATTGDLYYDAAGSTAGSTKRLIADLTNKPHLCAASLFFTS